MPLYTPSPAIPPGMTTRGWQGIITEAEREAARLLAKFARTGRVGVGDASRYATLTEVLSTLANLNPNEARLTAAVLGPVLSQLRDTLTLITSSLDAHARASVSDLVAFLQTGGVTAAERAAYDAGWAASARSRTFDLDAAEARFEATHGRTTGSWFAAGWTDHASDYAKGTSLAGEFNKTVDVRALGALTSRVQQNVTADWTRLAATTQQAVIRELTVGMAGGLSPREVAARIRAVGTLTHARALTIARTEMADLYDASRLGWMAENRDVVTGWWWRAQLDSSTCGICLTLHGRQFTVEEAPNRHHNCRCVMVPIPEGESKPASAKPVPRDRIVEALPKSWRGNLPDDLFDLLEKRDNPNWRPAWTLRKPAA